MKRIQHSIWLLLLLAIAACGGGGSGDQATSEPAVRSLTIGETQTNFIGSDGEVDAYRLRAAETNRFLHLHCEERTSGSNVDLLVTVFEEVDGERVRIFGKHKPDGAPLGADLDLWIFIDTPKDLFITVRDLMDDDASDSIPYYLTATFEDSAEGNHDFSNAQAITIGAADAVSDAIEEIGEVDCFTFAPTVNGVFSLSVAHNRPPGGSPVQLAVSLYDQNGNRIQRIADPYHTIRAYLTVDSGPYFVIVEDSDSLDSDLGAPYDIAIEQIAVDEAQDNDVSEDAEPLTADAQSTFTAAGTIDYGCSSISPGHEADTDWYQITLGSTGGATTYHQVLFTIDNGEVVDGTTPMRMVIYDDQMDLVTSHDFAIGSDAYQNQFRATNGVYFVSVAPANPRRLYRSTHYRVRLQESDSNDTVETTDDNTVNSSLALTEGDAAEGYISYQADVDWYHLPVDTTNDRIVSVDLTADASIVDLQLTVWRGVQMIKKVTDMNGSDGATHLKTSILVPADAAASPATFHFKVCDAQNNEGSSVAYQITASSTLVAPAPDAIAETTGQLLRHYGETSEEPASTDTVELEIFSNLQPQFRANTTWLDFRNGATPGIETSEPEDGTTVITFPWISGYIDYQGDRDFFQLDLGKLDSNGPETDWYYDVEVRLVVPSPGSNVEYVWKLYRDSNRNGIIMDDPTSPDGYKACAGDITPQTIAAEDIVTPDGGDTFWIGSAWGEDAKFYIALSDFNYLRLPATDTPNSDPDNDWGYDAPYYFTVVLTYHPGQAFPD